MPTEVQTTSRLARPEDIPVLFEIERASFPTPWTYAEIEEELSQPFSRLWVAEAEGRPVAFGIQWFIAGESQLADIAVHPDFRGRGLGKAMMRCLLDDARSAGMTKMTLELRVGNDAALGLYGGLGFVETSRRPRFYEDKDEAILMEMSLDENQPR